MSAIWISASAIDAFECLRKGAFKYVAGLKTPQTDSAVLGGELHSIAEDYLTVGKSPDVLTKAGAMFVSGLPHLPPPGSGGVEGEMKMCIEDVFYLGYIDYRGYGVPGLEGKLVTLDHKTSKSPDRYGLWDKVAFLKNIQAVLYATNQILETGTNEAHLRWLYYWTSGRERAKPSDIVLTRTELEDAFERVVHNPAKEVVKLRLAKPDPMDLAPNTQVCSKYGGCPFRSEVGGPCVRTQNQLITGAYAAANKKPKEEIMGLLDRIKKETGATGSSVASASVAGVPTAPTAPSAPPPPPSSAPKEDHVNAPEAQQTVATTAPAAAPAAAPPKVAARAGHSVPAAVAQAASGREKSVAALLRAIADVLDAG